MALPDQQLSSIVSYICSLACIRGPIVWATRGLSAVFCRELWLDLDRSMHHQKLLTWKLPGAAALLSVSGQT